MNGPGKYDALCTYVRQATRADAALVVVLGGRQGEGFSVQTRDRLLQAQLPELLRKIADSIEKQLREQAS